MVRLATTLVLAASLSASAIAADTVTCSASSQCPEDRPCCSQYGECGTGAYCLGGCDIRYSFSIDSCAPMPVCESKSYTWDNMDNLALNTKYLGDASKADWVYSGFPKIQDGSMLMTMPKNSVGTLISSSHYIFYGKVSGKFKSSRGDGVVSSFILMSDVQDEIDLEWVGADLTTVQSNYYWQGVLNWHHSQNLTIPGGDSFDDWHTYELDWSPNQLTWSVDGNVQRTLTKASTYDSSTNQYKYPQTPARLQFSIWPAGASSSAPGTIAWAGGAIDWNSQDIQQYGYDFATIGDVDVECYSVPSGTQQSGSNAYIYTSTDSMQSDIAIVNNSTILSSMGATGSDPSLGASASGSSASASASASDSVPSSSSGGTGEHAGSGGSGSTSASGGSSNTGSGSGSSSSGSGTFHQNGGSGGNSGSGSGTGNAAPSQNERVLRGSLFAVLVAVVVLVTL